MKKLLLLTALLLAACGTKQDQSSQAALQSELGKNLAQVAVQDLDGHPQPLNDALLLNGRPAVINVWATWCTPCQEEMAALDQLGRKKQFTVIAIATDSDRATVTTFLKKQNWGSGVTVLFDPLGETTRDKLGARALPTTLVTDKNLTVKLAEAGPRAWDSSAMADKLKTALK